jgi:hypothetical protein
VFHKLSQRFGKVRRDGLAPLSQLRLSELSRVRDFPDVVRAHRLAISVHMCLQPVTCTNVLSRHTVVCVPINLVETLLCMLTVPVEVFAVPCFAVLAGCTSLSLLRTQPLRLRFSVRHQVRTPVRNRHHCHTKRLQGNHLKGLSQSPNHYAVAVAFSLYVRSFYTRAHKDIWLVVPI